MESAVIIFVLGGPGSGKGTQCTRLVEDFGFIHLSAGDLLRSEMERENSQYGQLISNYIKEGQIVPTEIMLSLLEQAIKNNQKPPKSLFLLDGFPRQMDQAKLFEEKICECKAVVYFHCTEDEMLKRLLKRGETSGRSDDNEESIMKRFVTFKETSFPVIEYYDAKKKCIKIDSMDTPDDVYQITKNKVADLLSTKRPSEPHSTDAPPPQPQPPLANLVSNDDMVGTRSNDSPNAVLVNEPNSNVSATSNIQSQSQSQPDTNSNNNANPSSSASKPFTARFKNCCEIL